MQKTGEMIRNVCIGKLKVGEDLVNMLGNKQFPDNKELKCYVNCIFEMMQVVSFWCGVLRYCRVGWVLCNKTLRY